MKPICRTNIHVKIPSLSQDVNIEVDYNESVSELVARILDNFGIKDAHLFQLYGQNSDFRVIPENQKCAILLLNDYDSFVLNSSKALTINVYFENRRAIIDHDPNAIVSDILSVAANCLNMKMRSDDYYIAIDIEKNTILPSNQPIELVSAILIKSLDIYSPSVIFSPDFFKLNNVATPMLMLSLSSFLMTKQLQNLLTLILPRKQKEFNIVELSKKQMKKIYSAYLKETDLRAYPTEQLNSFLFAILASYEKPLFPKNIHKMAIKAMKKESFQEKLELTIITISYLPLAGYFILLEILQLFGGIPEDENNRKKYIFLISDLFFLNSLDRENELRFVAFVLMYYPIIFGIPFPSNSELRYKDSNLYIVRKNKDHYIFYSDLGPDTKVQYDETKPYSIKSSIVEILNKYIKNQPHRGYDLTEYFNKLNEKLDKLSNKFKNYKKDNVYKRQYLRTRNESFMPFEPNKYPLKELSIDGGLLFSPSKLNTVGKDFAKERENKHVLNNVECSEEQLTNNSKKLDAELDNISKHSLQGETLLDSKMKSDYPNEHKNSTVEDKYLDLSDTQISCNKRESEQNFAIRSIDKEEIVVSKEQEPQEHNEDEESNTEKSQEHNEDEESNTEKPQEHNEEEEVNKEKGQEQKENTEEEEENTEEEEENNEEEEEDTENEEEEESTENEEEEEYTQHEEEEEYTQNGDDETSQNEDCSSNQSEYD